MRFTRIALIAAISIMAASILFGTGCRGKKVSWTSPWGKKSSDDIPPPPMDAADGAWTNDLPGGFELPMMDPSQLPPLDVIEDKGIALADNPREDVTPASGLQTIFFGYDSAGLDDEMKATLDRNAAYLQSNPDMKVQVEGHCDDRGTLEYNFSLGQRRADVVREYLASKGIHPERLVTISYGEERPLSTGSSESAWTKNRRVQFMAY